MVDGREGVAGTTVPKISAEIRRSDGSARIRFDADGAGTMSARIKLNRYLFNIY